MIVDIQLHNGNGILPLTNVTNISYRLDTEESCYKIFLVFNDDECFDISTQEIKTLDVYPDKDAPQFSG